MFRENQMIKRFSPDGKTEFAMVLMLEHRRVTAKLVNSRLKCRETFLDNPIATGWRPVQRSGARAN